MNEGAFPFVEREIAWSSWKLRPNSKPKPNRKMKTFIKTIRATALIPFAARAKTKAALVGVLVLLGVTVLIILPARATPQMGVTSVTLAHGVLDEIDILTKTDLDPGPATDF